MLDYGERWARGVSLGRCHFAGLAEPAHDAPVTETGAAPDVLADALVVVDAQVGFLTGDLAVPAAAALSAALAELLDHARLGGAFVVHLQNDGPPGAVDEPGQPGWHLQLPPSAGEVVLRKTADDGFADTGLEELLRGHGVRRVVLGGLLSEMCVAATARAALARGFAVVLPRDAHATYDLGDIPAAVVARVAAHSLGDEVELPSTARAVRFTSATPTADAAHHQLP